ncbi:hypothetical protein HW132_35600 [Brasilonema sp. CT11]|nr:hypothetical protein [Brasilonema sp. CT11]
MDTQQTPEQRQEMGSWKIFHHCQRQKMEFPCNSGRKKWEEKIPNPHPNVRHTHNIKFG